MLVDRNHVHIVRFGDRCSLCDLSDDSGVVDQYVDRPEFRLALLDHASPRRRLRNVVRDEQGIRSELLGQRRALLFVDVGQNDLRALGHEPSGMGCSHTLRSPGDYSDLAGQSAHLLLLWDSRA